MSTQMNGSRYETASGAPKSKQLSRLQQLAGAAYADTPSATPPSDEDQDCASCDPPRF